jgi:hypothetical protein
MNVADVLKGTPTNAGASCSKDNSNDEASQRLETPMPVGMIRVGWLGRNDHSQKDACRGQDVPGEFEACRDDRG